MYSHACLELLCFCAYPVQATRHSRPIMARNKLTFIFIMHLPLVKIVFKKWRAANDQNHRT